MVGAAQSRAKQSGAPAWVHRYGWNVNRQPGFECDRPRAVGGDGRRNLRRLEWQTGAMQFNLGLDGFERLLLESHRLSTAPVGFRRPTSWRYRRMVPVHVPRVIPWNRRRDRVAPDDGRLNHATADASGPSRVKP